MPTYEFRCKTCDDTFEVRRAMSDAGGPQACPAGHDDTVRLLSMFASVGASASSRPTMTSAVPSGGGGCGSGCGCAH